VYVELHASSAFSFLQAASLPEALVDRAASLGYPALALLDRDGVYGAPRFHKAARAAGIQPIIGAELTVGIERAGEAGRVRKAGEAGKAGRKSSDFSVPPIQPIPPILPFVLPVLCESATGTAISAGLSRG
jgi:error-prone DNA polymerase